MQNKYAFYISLFIAVGLLIAQTAIAQVDVVNKGVSITNSGEKIYINGNLINRNDSLTQSNRGSIANGDSIFITGDIIQQTDNNLFTTSSGSVIFNGTGNQSVLGDSLVYFHSLVLNKITGNLVLQRPLRVRNNLNFLQGSIILGGYDVLLGTTGFLSNEDENNRVQNGSGYVRAQRFLNAAQANQSLAGTGLYLDYNLNPGTVQIRRGHGIQQNVTNESIERYFELDVSGNQQIDSFRIDYFNNELAGNNADSIIMWKSDDGGTSWNNIEGVLNSGAKFATGSASSINQTILTLSERDCDSLPDPQLPDTLYLCGSDSVLLNPQVPGLLYEWSTGSPNHTIYANNPGTYVVGVSTLSGCLVFDTVEVIQQPKPVAAFSTGNECMGDTVMFTNNTTISSTQITDWQWTFDLSGNVPDTAKTQNTAFLYPAQGAYQVQLVATTEYGCSDTAQNQVIVFPNPTADFDVFDACADSNVAFTNTSVIAAGGMLYQWDFGDGNNSAATNPNHLYSTVDSFQVELIATSNAGCTDTTNKIVNIFDNPAADFTVQPACAGQPVAITNNSAYTGGALNYIWDYSDNTVDTGATPQKSFAPGGIYTITLTANSNSGCADTAMRTVNITPGPVADFAANNPCDGGPVNFINNSTVFGTTNYFWDFDNGTTSIDSAPQITYNTPGIYNVSLVAVSNNGCSDTTIIPVTVYPNPTAAFTVSNACVNTQLPIVNNSSITSGTLNYSWNFNDGTTDTAQTPSKAYSLPTNYTIELIAASNAGCVDTAVQPVTVQSLPVVNLNDTAVCGTNYVLDGQNPGANYAWSTGGSSRRDTVASSGNYSLTVTDGNGCSAADTANVVINPTPAPDLGPDTVVCGSYNLQTGLPQSHLWSTNSTANNITVNQTGVYAVAVTNSIGCTGTDTVQVTVEQTPQVNLGSNVTTCAGDSITLDAGGGNVNYLWNTNETTREINVNATGGYAVTVSTSAGCAGSDSVNLTFRDAPVADFAYNDDCVNNSIAFTNNSTQPGGGGLSYSWNFDNGNTSTASQTSQSYTANGVYNVQLIAENSTGCADTVQYPVTVHPRPTVSFSAASVCLGDTTNLVNSSSVSGTTLSYDWDFANGNNSTAAQPQEVFAAAGSFPVKLRAETPFGCADSTTQNIQVRALPVYNLPDTVVECATSVSVTAGAANQNYNWSHGPSSRTATVNSTGTYVVTITRTNGCSIEDSVYVQLNNPLNFTLGGNNTGCDEVTLNPGLSGVNYQWSTGDTGSVLTINNSGTYSLQAQDTNGCSFADTVQVTVNQSPAVSLGGNDTLCAGTSKTLNAGNPAASHIWNTGSPNQALNISQSGTYSVTVTSSAGCSTADTASVVFNPVPVSDFTFSNLCEGDTVNFTNQTSGAPAGSSYQWNFGDGNTAFGQNHTHAYASQGTYQVTLEVTTPEGCSHTGSKQVSIHPIPTAGFSVQNVCEGSAVSFFNTSSITSGSLSYQWDFGNGASASNTNPGYTYPASGDYEVTLTAVSGNGCEMQFSDSVSVNPLPAVNLGGNITTCADSTLLNASSAGASYLWSNNTTDSVLNVNQNGQYSVTVTSPEGCTANDQVNVQLSSPVAVNLGPDTLVCDSISLDAGNQGASYAWNNAHTGRVLSVTNSGTYEVTVTDQNGCLGYDTVQITVQSGPVVNLGDDTAFCSSAPAYTLDAGAGAQSYLWSTGTTAQTLLADSSSNYAVTVTSANGCSQTDSVNVTVHETPAASFGVQNVCESSDAVFANTTTAQGAVNYTWNFGDGNGSTAANPSNNYPAGTFQPQLIAVTPQGCADTAAQSITVNPDPDAAFSASLGCVNQDVSFTDSSSLASGSFTHQWLFGNGNGSTLANPVETYNTTGFYPVTLVTASDSGCVDSITQVVQINSTPQAVLQDSVQLCDVSYTLNAQNTGSTFAWSTSGTSQQETVTGTGTYTVTVTNAAGCSIEDSSFVELLTPVSVNISGAANACDSTVLDAGNPGNSYVWSAGDTGQIINPTVSGTYAVTVTNAQGCSDDDQIQVTINNSPLVDLGQDTSVCAGSPYILDAGNSGANFAWSNAGTSQQQLISAPGTYSVTVTDQNGCTAGDTMVFGNYDVPNAAFTTNNVCVTDSIEFVNNSTIASGNMTYDWNFGDGQTDTATAPEHLYASAGNYLVNLTVTSSNGCQDVTSNQLQIRSKPNVSFNSPAACEGNQVNFVNTSNIPSGTLTYNWDFGDGTGSANTTPAKTYAAPGNYTVQLNATSNFGCQDSASGSVTVNPLPVLTMPDSIITCDADTVLDAGNPGASYVWSNVTFNQTLTVQNNGTYRVTVTTPQGCSADTGVYVRFDNVFSPDLPSQASGCDSVTVDAGNLGASYSWNTGDTGRVFGTTVSGMYTVDITDVNGCTTPDSVQITVHASPVVDLGPDTAFCDGNTLTLDAGNPGAQYTWNNNLTGQNPTISATGNYFVTVEDNNNCFGTDNMTLTVHALPQFNLGNDTLVCDSVQLSIPGGLGSYQWNTGDTVPAIFAADSGLYIAEVTSPQGCVFTDSVIVNTQPGQPFNLGNDTTLCAGASITLGSGITAPSYQWTFGSTDSSLTVGDSGTYWHKVTSVNGCVTTDTITISYFNNPQPDLGDDLLLCTGQEITLNTGSNPASDFTWYVDSTNAGDTTAVDSNLFVLPFDTASILAQDSGLYWVEVNDSNGCYATDTVHVSITDNFIESSFLSTSEAVVGDTIQFISISFPDSLPHSWNFGDGITSQQFDPQHAFFMSDTFNVSLVVSNGFCSDSISKPIFIGTGKKPSEMNPDTVPARYTDFMYAKFWPTPVREFGTLEYELENRAVVQIDLFDLNGALIDSRRVTERYYQTRLKTEHLHSGMYIIRLMTGNKQVTLKFIKN